MKYKKNKHTILPDDAVKEQRHSRKASMQHKPEKFIKPNYYLQKRNNTQKKENMLHVDLASNEKGNKRGT